MTDNSFTMMYSSARKLLGEVEELLFKELGSLKDAKGNLPYSPYN
jgi:hypothetical protein